MDIAKDLRVLIQEIRERSIIVLVNSAISYRTPALGNKQMRAALAKRISVQLKGGKLKLTEMESIHNGLVFADKLSPTVMTAILAEDDSRKVIIEAAKVAVRFLCNYLEDATLGRKDEEKTKEVALDLKKVSGLFSLEELTRGEMQKLSPETFDFVLRALSVVTDNTAPLPSEETIKKE